MFRCFFCNHELGWDNDFDADEMYGDDFKGRIVSLYTCRNCGAEYEVLTPNKDNYKYDDGNNRNGTN